MKLLHVVGARPNFPKLAPVYRAACAAGMCQLVVHTGQHYDENMSAAFFRDLGITAPEVNLAVGSASHAVQTARIMERLEPVLAEARPDWLVVYGDINSTMAAALVAAKLGVRTAHVEAGLRSHDLTMPEEINRIVTDRLAQLLLTPSRDADATLRAEGEPAEEIVFVGNVMIDSLFYALPAASATGFAASLGAPEGAPEGAPDGAAAGTGEHVAVTLHRPSNVDDPVRLAALAGALRAVAEERPVYFPAHPRTQARIRALGADFGAVQVMDPIGYLQMLDLVRTAHAVVTDSGGLQEETTALAVPCFTVRPNTERPVTVTEGSNVLVQDPAALPALVRGVARGTDTRRPEGWDGHAGERVVAALAARPAQA